VVRVSDERSLDQTVDQIGDEVRPALEERRQQLESQLGDLQVDDLAKTKDENFADGAQVAAEQDEVMALATDLRSQLEDVQRALDKLDAGTYGICEVCGERIPDARLEAMPAARYCMRHAG
jgi:DnaK suppressor protein